MVKTRSMTKNQKHDDDASNMKRIKTICDNGGLVLWSDINHDVLLLVMMELGVVDFLAFGGVCKSWRSLALVNKNKFILSMPPMSISISTNVNEKECCLEDFEGRKFKTILPHSSGRTCVGLTFGYLILFGEKHQDFWLVNLITRHELHFPPPNEFNIWTGSRRATLVFSPSISQWVFVVLSRCYSYKIWFCIAGKQEWNYVSLGFPNNDLLAFKEKIYTLHYSCSFKGARLYELKFNELVLLETKRILIPYFTNPRFVSCGENLYVINRDSKHPYKIYEIDIDEMKLVSCEKKVETYAFFCSDLRSGVAITPSESWADLHLKYKRFSITDEIGGKCKIFNAKMWYFFHDCLNVNLVHE